MIELPQGKWDVIVADCPWFYHTSHLGRWGAAAKFYELLTDEEINALPIADLLYPDSVVFLWATSPRIGAAVKAIEAWGLHCRGVQFVWIKTKKDGKTPIGAQGVKPSIVKPLTEFVLGATVKPRGRPRPLASQSVCQTVFAPRREHSRKPDEVMERIEQLYPDASKIELFARGKARDGWDNWGDEAE